MWLITISIARGYGTTSTPWFTVQQQRRGGRLARDRPVRLARAQSPNSAKKSESRGNLLREISVANDRNGISDGNNVTNASLTPAGSEADSRIHPFALAEGRKFPLDSKKLAEMGKSPCAGGGFAGFAAGAWPRLAAIRLSLSGRARLQLASGCPPADPSAPRGCGSRGCVRGRCSRIRPGRIAACSARAFRTPPCRGATGR